MVQGKQIKDSSIKLIKVNPMSGQLLTLQGTTKIQQNAAPTVGIDLTNKTYVDALVSAVTVTAANGLTVTSGTIQLGGPLIMNTAVDGASLYGLSITDVTLFEVSSTLDIELLAGNNAYISAAFNIYTTAPGDMINSFGNEITNQTALGNITNTASNGDLVNNAVNGSMSNVVAADINNIAGGDINNTATTGDISITASLGKIMYLAYDDVTHRSTTGSITNTALTFVLNKVTDGVDVTTIGIYSTGQSVANNGVGNTMIVTDEFGGKGMVYAVDYSVNFTPESLVSKRYVDALVLTAGGVPTLSNKSMVAMVTSLPGQQISAGLAMVPKNDSYVQVFINGLKVSVGDGVGTDAVYFAAPGTPGTPKPIIAITTGDILVRGTALGYNTDATDAVDYDYQA